MVNNPFSGGPFHAEPPPPPRPSGGEWGISEALLVLVVFLLAQMGAGYVVSWALDSISQDSRFVVTTSAILFSHVVGWGAMWFLLVRWRRLGFRASLALTDPPTELLAGAFIAGLVLQVLVALLSLAAPPPPDFASPFQPFVQAGWPGLMALGVLALVLAPLLEESLFRGMLLPPLRARLGFPMAALVVTALFTALHATQTGTYWPGILGIFICGMVLAWLREDSDSLWPPVIFHAGFNTTAFLATVAFH